MQSTVGNQQCLPQLNATYTMWPTIPPPAQAPQHQRPQQASCRDWYSPWAEKEFYRDFSGGSVVESLPCNAGDTGSPNQAKYKSFSSPGEVSSPFPSDLSWFISMLRTNLAMTRIKALFCCYTLLKIMEKCAVYFLKNFHPKWVTSVSLL